MCVLDDQTLCNLSFQTLNGKDIKFVCILTQQIQVTKAMGGKLIHCNQVTDKADSPQVFDGIQAVLFLVSASCFDLVIREDQETNRLQESINIFKSVWHSR